METANTGNPSFHGSVAESKYHGRAQKSSQLEEAASPRFHKGRKIAYINRTINEFEETTTTNNFHSIEGPRKRTQEARKIRGDLKKPKYPPIEKKTGNRAIQEFRESTTRRSCKSNKSTNPGLRKIAESMIERQNRKIEERRPILEKSKNPRTQPSTIRRIAQLTLPGIQEPRDIYLDPESPKNREVQESKNPRIRKSRKARSKTSIQKSTKTSPGTQTKRGI